MSEATIAQPEIPENVSALTAGFPKWERLSAEAALQPCDGHSSGAVNALVIMILASGSTVLLCGNCARRSGYEHTNSTPEDNRQKGSEH